MAGPGHSRVALLLPPVTTSPRLHSDLHLGYAPPPGTGWCRSGCTCLLDLPGSLGGHKPATASGDVWPLFQTPPSVLCSAGGGPMGGTNMLHLVFTAPSPASSMELVIKYSFNKRLWIPDETPGGRGRKAGAGPGEGHSPRASGSTGARLLSPGCSGSPPGLATAGGLGVQGRGEHPRGLGRPTGALVSAVGTTAGPPV